MIKIKIENVRSNKKYKLYRAMAGILASTIVVSSVAGCQEIKNYKKNKSIGNYTNSAQESINDSDANYNSSESFVPYNNCFDSENLVSEEELNKFISLKVYLSNQDCVSYNQYITSIDTNYPYSELYYITENYSKYNNLNVYKSDFESNQITADYIYNVVCQNNTKNDKKETIKISNNELAKICNEIASMINYLVSNNKQINYELLLEKINNLKINNFTGFSNGSYDSTTGVMWLDVSKLNTNEENFKKIIDHETVHLIQSNSLSELNYSNIETRIGCSYRFKDSKVNSLNWTWFSEGSAESIMMSKNQTTKALTYENLIRIIEIVKTATILNPDNNESSFEYLSLNSSLNDLFKYFDCESDKEKIEILNLMFSCELISSLSGSKSVNEFYKNYELEHGKMSFSQKQLFEKKLKGSIAQTLSKNFYYNLITNSKGKDVSINEIFELISIFESELNKLTWYSTTGYAKDISDFMINYINIQNNFFGILSQKLNVSQEQIQSYYDAYNSISKSSIRTFSTLSSEKSNYYLNIKENRKNDKTYSIREVYQKTLNYEKKR